jgi:putative membrane protein (TIGR04086 family)
VAVVRLLDREAILKGAALAVIVCLPLALLAAAVVDEDDPGPLAPILYLAVLLGFVLGGWAAGRAAPEAPFSNGAVAALAAFVVIQGGAVLVRVVAGDSVTVGRIIGTGLLAYGCGLTGGLVADRLGRRGRATET